MKIPVYSLTHRDEVVVQEREASFSPSKQYLDLLAYIVSNTVAGEIMAVENYSQMVPLIDDTDEKIETVEQARDETKHILLLSKLGRRLSFPVERRIVEPQWHAIRGHFGEAVERKDLAACIIGQDVMVETMAVVLYKTLAGDGAKTDKDTATMAHNILKDEVEHLGVGVDRMRRMLDENPNAVHDSLVWAHYRIMPQLFGLIRSGCDSLCGVLGIECGSFGTEAIQTDLDTLRIRAVDQYMESLGRVGFDAQICDRLVADLASYSNDVAQPAIEPCCAQAVLLQSEPNRCC